MIINPVMYSGRKLPELDNPGTAADLLAGKQLVDQYGNPLTGTMPQRSASNLTASGKTVTVPAGYYPSQVSKSVATATQATPSITVDSAGKITASATQTAGYVSAGTKSATKQLTTQAAQTITPGTSDKTIAAGRYLTGAQTIKGDANLLAENIKEGVSIFGVEGDLQAQETVKLTFNISSTVGVSDLRWVCYSNLNDLNFWTTGWNKTYTLKKNELIVLNYTSQYNSEFTFSDNIMVCNEVLEGASYRYTDYYYFLVIKGDSTITVKFS